MALPATIPEQIKKAKQNEMGYRALHTSAVIYNDEDYSAIEVPFASYTDKYHDFLSNHMVERYLTEEDCAYYRYRPKMFSLDIYGTTEFWNDILILNNCASIRDFQPNPVQAIRFYDPSYLKTLLNEILIIEGRV